jgi:phage-related protein
MNISKIIETVNSSIAQSEIFVEDAIAKAKAFIAALELEQSKLAEVKNAMVDRNVTEVSDDLLNAAGGIKSAVTSLCRYTVENGTLTHTLARVADEAAEVSKKAKYALENMK